MTDEQTESPYFWSNESKEDLDKIDAYIKEAFFIKMAEWVAEEINKRFNDLSYDETTKTISVGRSE